jgi:hypothetical protein
MHPQAAAKLEPEERPSPCSESLSGRHEARRNRRAPLRVVDIRMRALSMLPAHRTVPTSAPDFADRYPVPLHLLPSSRVGQEYQWRCPVFLDHGNPSPASIARTFASVLRENQSQASASFRLGTAILLARRAIGFEIHRSEFPLH